MCEVTRSNFKEKLAEIKKHAPHAAFIAIDAEFTGIRTTTERSISLFDDPERRYQKLRTDLGPYRTCQVGVSLFHHVHAQNEYKAYTYNFYVYPKSLPGAIDEIVHWETACVEFLKNNGFDFVKLFHEGIPYIPVTSDNQIRQKLHSLNMSTKFSLNTALEQQIKQINMDLSKWLRKCDADENFVINTEGNEFVFVLHIVIRSAYPNIWTFQDNDKLIVTHAPPRNQMANLKINDCLVKMMDDYLDYHTGFTHVFRLLMDLKKPIVGHNIFVDLLMLYNHFYGPLPRTYKIFKTDIHKMFPRVFDTKHICHELRHNSSGPEVLEQSNLGELHAALSSKPGALSLYCPRILHQENFDRYSSKSFHHEAGFDAFCTGYCFLHLAQFSAVNKFLNGSSRPMTSVEHLSSLKQFENCLHIPRASVPYLNVGGEDPPSKRPAQLLFELKNPDKRGFEELIDELSSFRNVDIQHLSSTRIVAAVGNFRSARTIECNYRHSRWYRVSKYETGGARFSMSDPRTWIVVGLSGVALYYVYRRGMASRM